MTQDDAEQAWEFGLWLSRAVTAAEAGALREAGCTGTSPAGGVTGFRRRGPSLAQAVMSAARDIGKVPGLEVTAVGLPSHGLLRSVDFMAQVAAREIAPGQAEELPRDDRWKRWTDQQVRDFITARRDTADSDTEDLITRMEEELDAREEYRASHEDTPALDPPWWEYR
jgi:hypothetical protein